MELAFFKTSATKSGSTTGFTPGIPSMKIGTTPFDLDLEAIVWKGFADMVRGTVHDDIY
jgi:hypothetical protein